MGPVTKLRETPEITTGGTKIFCRGTGERAVARPGLHPAPASAVFDRGCVTMAKNGAVAVSGLL